MKDDSRRSRAGLLVGFTGVLLIAACTVLAPAEGEKAASPSGEGRSGAELWAERCGLCHNSRSPESLSDSQWYTALAHMRVQAYLTGEEELKIRTFLQAGN